MNKILQAENGQNVDEFEHIYIAVITAIDEKWFVIVEHTINHLSFAYVRLPQLEYYLSCLRLFSNFCFLLPLSTFKPLNALYLKFERLKISGRTFERLKSGVPDWGNPSQSGSLNFLSSESLHLDGSNFRNG